MILNTWPCVFDRQCSLYDALKIIVFTITLGLIAVLNGFKTIKFFDVLLALSQVKANHGLATVLCKRTKGFAV